jgi:hypothetical protein
MKTRFAQFNRFEIELPLECIEACSHSGACDDDVAHWKPILKLKIDPELLARELQEYGAWDAEELADHEANLDRIIWLAASDLSEEIFMESSGE